MPSRSGSFGRSRKTIREREGTEAGLKQMEASIARGTVPLERLKDIDYVQADMKQQLASQREQEQRLRSTESDVSMRIASEQGQWLDFNARLDELERALPSSGPR